MCENVHRIDCDALEKEKGINSHSDQERQFEEQKEYILGQTKFDIEKWLSDPVKKGETILTGIDPRTF